jgi:hypothetical protein
MKKNEISWIRRLPKSCKTFVFYKSFVLESITTRDKESVFINCYGGEKFSSLISELNLNDFTIVDLTKIDPKKLKDLEK